MIRYLKSIFSVLCLLLVLCSSELHKFPDNFEYTVAGEAYIHIRLFMTSSRKDFPRPGIVSDVLIKDYELNVNTESAEDFIASLYSQGFYTNIDWSIWTLYYHYDDADSTERRIIMKSYEPWITMGPPNDWRWSKSTRIELKDGTTVDMRYHTEIGTFMTFKKFEGYSSISNYLAPDKVAEIEYIKAPVSGMLYVQTDTIKIKCSEIPKL